MSTIGRILFNIFDPFEILYLAVAIATFSHTVWSAAFAFEGPPPPVGSTEYYHWQMSGILIAIAVDVGMLLTSRFLQSAKMLKQKVILAISFVVAALASFYTQLLYMGYHTPIIPMSEGVAEYWMPFLTQMIEARVILLPLALPVLATIYTIARIFRHQEKVVQQIQQQQVRGTVEILREAQNDHLKALMSAVRDAPRLLESGKNQVESGGYVVNLQDLTWYDPTRGKTLGPYKSVEILYATLAQARRKQREEIIQAALPSGIDE